MLLIQRKQTIMDFLTQHGVGSISGLSQLLNVSEMTVRRDLKLLEEEGRIQRIHGGAVQIGAANEPPFEEKVDYHLDLKHRLARYAAERFVEKNSVIIMEGGTTVTCMVGFLQGIEGLTVVTNGFNTLSALKHHVPQTSVICCGGMLRDRSYTFVGPLAEQFFQGIRAHYAFFSASGLTIEQGFSDPNMLEGQVKKAMSRAAKTKVMLVDSSKFGNLALLTTFAIREIDVVITDPDAPADFVRVLREDGVDVRIAE